MANIKLLSENLIAQIAAGEVIENPVGVVKELIENSIDAKAQNIQIFIHGDGYDLIQIVDDGSGMSKADLELAPKNFSSSKISFVEDLFKLTSLGFRGEALSSIRSVSRIEIETTTSLQSHGWKITAEADQIDNVEPSSINKGTTVRVRDLFFNLPVRREFNLNSTAIRKAIIRQTTALALINPQVRFLLEINDKEIFRLNPRKELTERLLDLLGENIHSDIKPIYFKEDPFEIRGYISKFDHYKSSKDFIYTFVNKRWVNIKGIIAILKKVYGELMPVGRYPLAILEITLPPNLIDPNIHPQKKEIVFRKQTETLNLIEKSLRSFIESRAGFRSSEMDREKSIPEQHKIVELIKKEHPTETKTQSSPPPDFEGSILGRLFDTYLVVTAEEKLILVDQHTAHERINFEKILEQISAKTPASQKITPIGVQIAPDILPVIFDYKSELTSIGFEWENLGPAGIKLTAIPEYVQAGNEEPALLLACQLLTKQKKLTPDALFINLAKDLSCRASIRKGQAISSFQLRELLNRLMLCKTPGRCPHGRPTMVTFDRSEINHLFKR